MDSSVKYEKFAASNEEDKPEKHTTKRKSTLGILVVAIVGISVASIIAIGVGVGVSAGRKSEQDEPSGLKIITATENKIEGEYYGSAGGIYFLSIVNGSDTTLTIIASNGKIIVSARHPQDSSMAMMSMQGTHFLFMENQPGSADFQGFTIPENNLELMKSMIEKNPNASEVMSMVDSTNATEVYQYSFELVIMCPEAELIIEAVQALGGGLNMKGSDYPSAMPFYLLALTLAKASIAMERTQNPEHVTRRYVQRAAPVTCKPNSFLGVPYLYCPTCPNDKCTGTDQHPCPISKREYNNDCFGMCGPGCTCWPWLCGTDDANPCCSYQGCLGHDRCCSGNGYVTMGCGKALFGYFKCNEPYKC